MSLVRIVGMFGEAHAVPMVQTGTIAALSPPQRTVTLNVSDGTILTITPGFAGHFGGLLLEDLDSLLIEGGTDRIQLQGLVKDD